MAELLHGDGGHRRRACLRRALSARSIRAGRYAAADRRREACCVGRPFRSAIPAGDAAAADEDALVGLAQEPRLIARRRARSVGATARAVALLVAELAGRAGVLGVVLLLCAVAVVVEADPRVGRREVARLIGSNVGVAVVAIVLRRREAGWGRRALAPDHGGRRADGPRTIAKRVAVRVFVEEPAGGCSAADGRGTPAASHRACLLAGPAGDLRAVAIAADSAAALDDAEAGLALVGVGARDAVALLRLALQVRVAEVRRLAVVAARAIDAALVVLADERLARLDLEPAVPLAVTLVAGSLGRRVAELRPAARLFAGELARALAVAHADVALRLVGRDPAVRQIDLARGIDLSTLGDATVARVDRRRLRIRLDAWSRIGERLGLALVVRVLTVRDRNALARLDLARLAHAAARRLAAHAIGAERGRAVASVRASGAVRFRAHAALARRRRAHLEVTEDRRAADEAGGRDAEDRGGEERCERGRTLHKVMLLSRLM